MDTFDYFRYAARKNLSYNLIVLDPPSFARNKKKLSLWQRIMDV